MDDLIARFAPPRLTTDPMFHAVLACLLGGYRWTKPYCERVIITPGGHFIGVRPGGEADDFGPVAELEHNLRGVVEAVGLTADEKVRFATLITMNIVVHGGRFDAFETLGVSPPDPLWN